MNEKGRLEWLKKIIHWFSNIFLSDLKHKIDNLCSEFKSEITKIHSELKIDITGMHKDIDYIKENVGEIKPDLKDVRERVANIEGRLSQVTAAGSPTHLTDFGKEILEESGIKEFVEKTSNNLLTQLKKDIKEQPPKAYDIQEWCLNKFDTFGKEADIPARLKEYAFSRGVSMSDIFRVGAIYFRDIAIKHFGLKVEDLDAHCISPKTTQS